MLALIALGSLFTDHMVLQRGRANPVWGSDQPQQVVTLTVEGAPAVATPAPVRVTTAADGTWQLACPALPAGGPYRLRVAGSSTQVIDDVLVGDVWIASGQSNMEFPLARAENADRAIAAANVPAIRVVKIPRLTARAPLAQLPAPATWQPATPQAAPSFTAVGWFFAQELHQHAGVPIGVIDSTWGGTRVEAWTSHEGLRPLVPGLDAELNRYVGHEDELAQLRADYAAKLAAWERASFPQDTGNEGETRGWAGAAFDDHAWRTLPLPGPWQAHGFRVNGAAWFRRTIEVPAADAGHDLVLHLGAIDDFDTTYWNGEHVGATQADTPNAYEQLRAYRIPGRLVHAGANTIAVRVFDRFGDGGFMGPAAALFAENPDRPASRQPLDGDWRWQFEREIPLVSSDIYHNYPPVPAGLDDPNAATALYNAMIAPLVPYGIRGFIWYQGEANVREHRTYRDRFTALIRDWRTRWGEGTLPFYFVQLASFTESADWPFLREAQAQTLAEPATGMAVIMDIGNRTDIHPRNKLDVGHRLALLARRDLLGENDLVASGPALDHIEIADGTARVRFRHAAGLCTRDGAAPRGFAVAGADGAYHAADARIDGDAVVLTCAAVPAPRSVRYAWADWLEVNLENAAGLPAAPFRTDAF